jgi:hypothetical protein
MDKDTILKYNIHPIEIKKQEYIEQFTTYIDENYTYIFEYNDNIYEILLSDETHNGLKEAFFKFVGEVKMPIFIFEKTIIDTFIKLSLSYFYYKNGKKV